MMQAITTKFIGPTNHRGSRIRAKCAAKTIYVPYEHALSEDMNHSSAAECLVEAMEWQTWFGKMIGGSLPNSEGYCFVAVPQKVRV